MRRLMLPFTILISLIWVLPVSADDFWTTREIAEIDGFSELDGVIKMKFKDAVSAAPLAGLKFTLDDGSSLTGDADGVVQFPSSMVEDIVDKDIPFTVTKAGYIPYRDAIKVRVGTVITKRFVVSPTLPVNQARLVVEWEKRPADLDAWLVGPNFTVSYRSMKNAAGNANLDRDARNGFGPETLTLLNVDQTVDYLFSVANYSKEAPISGVKVSLYVNNALAKVLFLNRTSDPKVDVVRIRKGVVEFLVQ